MRVETVDGQAEEWVRVTVARDPDTADRWRDALEGAGIGTEVRLEDVLEALPGATTLPGALPDLRPFAYAVYVPADARAAALRALIDAGWNGRTGRTDTSPVPARTLLVGATWAAVAGVIAVVVARLLAG